MAGALLASFLAGWLRRALLAGIPDLVLSLPWIPLRRLVLGLLFDLPTAAVILFGLALAGRVFVLKAWPTSLYLTGAVWLLDGLVSWLVLADLGLWTDPLVVIPRLTVAALTALGGAFALGWRPRRRSAKAGNSSEQPVEDDARSSEEV